MRPQPNALIWLWLSAVVIALDQLSKWWAVHALQPMGLPHPVIPGFLNWTLAFNRGAAFSFLADGGGWQRWFFALIAVAACMAMLWFLRRGGRALFCAGLALIIGGALGNLFDRLTLGHVVDFLLLHWRGWYYPAFNVADSAITIGAVALIIDSFRDRRPREPSAGPRER
jgi:signal peptidase II